MLAEVIQIKPLKPVVSESCKWHSAFESIAASNFKVACAWQRMVWRAIWGL